MFASIFTLKQNFITNGILNTQSCVHIWRPPRYPPSLHFYLLQLLVKFELIFPLSLPNPSLSFKASPIQSSHSLNPMASSQSLTSQGSLREGKGSSALAGANASQSEIDLYILPMFLPQRDFAEFRKHWVPFSELVGVRLWNG